MHLLSEMEVALEVSNTQLVSLFKKRLWVHSGSCIVISPHQRENLMAGPDIYRENGYEIMQSEKGWVVFNDEGVRAGPFTSLDEARKAARDMEPER